MLQSYHICRMQYRAKLGSTVSGDVKDEDIRYKQLSFYKRYWIKWTAVHGEIGFYVSDSAGIWWS